MGYAHIENLYKNQDILAFKECYALEKIHGTSAHISFSFPGPTVKFFAGGESHEKFVALFDEEALKQNYASLVGAANCVIHGEAYGGKQQGMKATYGDKLKFVVFDVKIDDHWLDVVNAEDVAKKLGLEFVHYVRIPATVEEIDKQRDADSVQAVRNGMGVGKKREGVVLRPIFEVIKNNGARIVSKHKRDDFQERKTPQAVTAEKQKALDDAEAIASEWVVPMRLMHVMDRMRAEKSRDLEMQDTGDVIEAMIEDVMREAVGEVVDNKDVRKAVGHHAAKMFKEYLKEALNAHRS